VKSFDNFLGTLTQKDLESITEQAQSELMGDGTYSEQEMRLATSIAQSAGIFYPRDT